MATACTQRLHDGSQTFWCQNARQNTAKDVKKSAKGGGFRRVYAVSAHRRDGELGAFLDAARPARRHRLGLGVEADRVGAMLVQVAEP